MSIRLKTVFLFSVFITLIFCANAQNTPPTIIATGNQNFCPNTSLNIATSVTITDPDINDSALDFVTIQISEGYSINEDTLVLSGSFPSISSSWSANQGALTLTGPANFTVFENAIQNVQFQTTQTTFTEDKFFSINIGSANYLPSTDHYYFYVSDLGITWMEANAASNAQDYFGLQGYLATITTAEESQLAGEQSPGAGWIGASDEEVENTWKWVTGPEAGTVFWIGDFNGSSQNGEFSFWNAGEPNNFNGNEDYAHITDPSIGQSGSWNDLPVTGELDTSSPFHPKGYLVEFGGMPGDPMVNLSASTTIVTPRILQIDNNSFCEGDVISVTVNTNTDSVLWYNSFTSNTPIFIGSTYSPSITTTTQYWVTPVFSGCNNGEKTLITVNINPAPELLNISLIGCEDEVVHDGATTFNLNNEFSNIVDGTLDNLTIAFFSDISLTNSVDVNTYVNTSNPQTLYTLVTNTISGCTSTSSVLLEVSTDLLNNATLIGCENDEANGIANFNLLEAIDQILLGLSPNIDLEFYASLEDVSLQVNQLSVNFTNTIPFSQTVYVIGNENGNCFGVAELELLVNEAPEALPDIEIYYCLNEFPNTITLSSGIIGDISNYSYAWSTAEITESIQINEIAEFNVVITDNLTGCETTRNINIEPSNIATIETINVIDASQNNSITINVTGEGEYEYALDNSNGIYQNSNTFTNVSSGIHTVYVRDVLNNCGIVNSEVSVIGYPNYFTPNGDDINDTWSIKGLSENFNDVFVVNIYDRYGKLLYTLKNKDDSWNGTYNNSKMPQSDYWFTVFIGRGKYFRGHFTLKR